jgi:uncharacterized membrane protein
MNTAESSQSTDPRIVGYLDALTQALKGLPEPSRTEVYDEIRQHIDDQLAQRGNDASAVPDILDRLGDPADIAREAGGDQAASPTPATAKRTHELVALTVLEVGGLLAGITTFLLVSHLIRGGSAFGLSILVGFVGWLVGVILVCTSGRFSTADKVIGIVLFPGGFAGSLVVIGYALVGSVGQSSCTSGQVTSDHGHVTTLTSCTGGTDWWVVAIAAAVAVVAALGPIYTTVRLGGRVART